MMQTNHRRGVAAVLGSLLTLASLVGPVCAQEPAAAADPSARTRAVPAKPMKPKAAAPHPVRPKASEEGFHAGLGASARNIVKFEAAPFPISPDARIPESDEPFFAMDAGGRFHRAPRGGKLYEKDHHYDDQRSLVVVPPGFDPRPLAVLVVFFHGNLATLSRDVVRRQKVVEQFERSGLNALLVAPQLVVDALDSSPGRFYERGFLDKYLAEAAIHLADRSNGAFSADYVQSLPVLFVAYSGGYLATAYSLPAQSGTTRHVAGVVLLDSLFGEEEKFADWIEASHRTGFFVSAFSASSSGQNSRLSAELAANGLKPPARKLPTALEPGDIVLLPAMASVHNDFLTAAWCKDPLEAVLKLVAKGKTESTSHENPDNANRQRKPDE